RQPQIAIVDLLPGGVEPVIELQPAADSSTPSADPALRRQAGAVSSLPVGVPGKSDWSPSHIDVREDRLVLYGAAPKKAGPFDYRVRATNAATSHTPPPPPHRLYNPSAA